jgi:hypothetical protein
MDKRHFTVVIGSKEHGLYISSKPSSAAKKAVSKLCASNKSKKIEFCLREITQGSKKKTYGPYLGEMKKLKKPIELEGRVIRYETIVYLKKVKRSTIKTAKKMLGGSGSSAPNGEGNEILTLDTANSISKLYDFINKKFLNEHNIRRNSFNSIKTNILSKISRYITRRQTEPKTEREREIRVWDIVNIFYIYDSSNNKIISLGIITPNYESRHPNCKTIIYNSNKKRKEYLYINYLLSRIKGGGINALYHILSRLPSDKYSGICLHPLRNLKNEYYQKLGFIEYSTITKCVDDDLHILDKTEENIRKLEAKLPHPITTEFYSTYPNNIIT